MGTCPGRCTGRGSNRWAHQPGLGILASSAQDLRPFLPRIVYVSLTSWSCLESLPLGCVAFSLIRWTKGTGTGAPGPEEDVTFTLSPSRVGEPLRELLKPREGRPIPDASHRPLRPLGLVPPWPWQVSGARWHREGCGHLASCGDCKPGSWEGTRKEGRTWEKRPSLDQTGVSRSTGEPSLCIEPVSMATLLHRPLSCQSWYLSDTVVLLGG